MITHGKKQISEIVYARKASEGGGAVRLTNIIRGAQVVFGGLMPSFGWLEKATKAAILAAFGKDDGYAVLGATNAYLNALEATDPTKASALAGFINEDPMMVCSLGLQPQGVEMPIRWIVNGNTAYIITDIIGQKTDIFHFYFYNTTDVQQATIFGEYPSLYFQNWQTKFYVNGVKAGNSPIDTEYDAYCNQSNFTINGKSFNYNRGNGKHKYGLFCFYYNGYTQVWKGKISILECLTEGREMKLIPFNTGKAWSEEDVSTGVAQAAGTCGMIDTLTGTFYPNANTSGSFTIEYTLPDGTPWTPCNQTP